ncbi:MAG: sigma-70 family RNA polymerase sigma factor [Alphaproteobacteria bacterium]|nr:sigma-70 family RNA polymerase sigma factor [Alphaproteobacteria bacterium]
MAMDMAYPAQSPAQPSDEASLWLTNIARQQDKTAFVSLFNYFAPRVKAYLRRQGVDANQADDITQDVMLQVWNRAAQFDATKSRPSTWIYTIARNRLIDIWRSQKNNLVEYNDPALIPDSGPDTAYDQTHAIDSEQQNDTLRSAVAELSNEQRQIIEETYFQERSQRMIAAARKIPLGTVKSRLRLALDHLRQKITRD